MDWFPWYFQLYEADTIHLTPYQDGCYRRLIDHYMKTRQPLPDNDHALARIVGDSHANWVANGVAMVRPFFRSQNGLLYLKRCEEILNDQDRKTKKLSESGKSGAKKRWNNINTIDSPPNGVAMASAIAKERTGKEDKESKRGEFSPLTPSSPKPKKEKRIGKRLDDWLAEQGSANHLPPDWRDYARTLGIADDRLATIAVRFRRYWASPDARGGGIKRDWTTTWKNWVDDDIQRNPVSAGARSGGGYSPQRVMELAAADKTNSYRPEPDDPLFEMFEYLLKGK